MGLITKEVEVKWHPKTKKHYENLGYIFTNWKDVFIIPIQHLTNGSGIKVDVRCDNCRKELKNIPYCNYNNYLKDNKYYCNECANKLFSHEKMRLTKLKNGISFGEYLINLYGNDAINQYWSQENIISPYDISYSSTQQIYINCLKKSYHGSYSIHCNEFAKGQRCPFCNSNQVHILDSLGTLYPQVLEIWSYNNNFSPFEVSPMTWREAEWECKEGVHENYKRQINVSNMCNFRCPECQYSKGEERISNYFINRGFIKIADEDYKILDNIFKNKYYIPQKKFDNLIGLGNGSLSYDFYLPNKQYNLLIEYDGEYHFKPIRKYKNEPIKYAEERLKKQQEHDRLKTEYAEKHNIKLLRIPYWDFDNIEEILDEYLNNIVINNVI